MTKLYFPNLGNYGRFGNQLFQIAATIGIARKFGMLPQFPANWAYRKYFNIPDEYFYTRTVQLPVYRERQFEYYDVELPNTDISILGYFQSPKYWAGHEADIKAYLTPKGVNPGSIDRVAIHYRRGDYVGNSNYVNLETDYYLKAYEMLGGGEIYAYGDDAKYIECNHPGVYHEGKEIQHLSAAIESSKHIVANSSFSWWAAYLSGGEVVRPAKHFAGALSANSVADLYPTEWQVCDGGKVDAKDVAFIIPVMYDHPDRLDNFRLCVSHLKKHFNAAIYVGEINTRNFDIDAHTLGCHYTRYEHPKFHRTKAINDLTRWAQKQGAKYVFNWDCDVLFPPFQTYDAIQRLRNGADFVSPHDGRWTQYEKEKHGTFARRLDLGDLSHIKHHQLWGLVSVGGAIGYNVQSFWEAGGENETFISYGPEDQERWWRFNLLGYRCERVTGPIYHLEHYRGKDSKEGHEESARNHLYWKRAKFYNRDEYRKHIATWPWANPSI